MANLSTCNSPESAICNYSNNVASSILPSLFSSTWSAFISTSSVCNLPNRTLLIPHVASRSLMVPYGRFEHVCKHFDASLCATTNLSATRRPWYFLFHLLTDRSFYSTLVNRAFFIMSWGILARALPIPTTVSLSTIFANGYLRKLFKRI